MAHAYVISGPLEEGRKAALDFVERELGLVPHANPDVIEITRGLFTVDDARELFRTAYQAPMQGERKVLLVSAGRMYHEAQNALLKLFEEPPLDTTLFLIVPMEGMLIGTLRSRLVALPGYQAEEVGVSEAAREFLAKDAKGRGVLILKLSNAKDDDDKRESRDTALSILDGVEATLYDVLKKGKGSSTETASLLSDLQTLRSCLLDRSSSIKMILEHIALTTPVVRM